MVLSPKAERPRRAIELMLGVVVGSLKSSNQFVKRCEHLLG